MTKGKNMVRKKPAERGPRYRAKTPHGSHAYAREAETDFGTGDGRRPAIIVRLNNHRGKDVLVASLSHEAALAVCNVLAKALGWEDCPGEELALEPDDGEIGEIGVVRDV